MMFLFDHKMSKMNEHYHDLDRHYKIFVNYFYAPVVNNNSLQHLCKYIYFKTA